MGNNKYKKQSTKFTCGLAALINCLLYFGINTTERYLRNTVGIQSDKKNGTNPKGIIKGIEYFGFNYKVHYSISSGVFKKKLVNALKSGSTCIILVRHCEHWIAALEYINRKISIIDSGYKEENGKKINQNINMKSLIAIANNFDQFYHQKNFFEFIEILKK